MSHRNAEDLQVELFVDTIRIRNQITDGQSRPEEVKATVKPHRHLTSFRFTTQVRLRYAQDGDTLEKVTIEHYTERSKPFTERILKTATRSLRDTGFDGQLPTDSEIEQLLTASVQDSDESAADIRFSNPTSR
ncbi:MAG: hypothetical protein ABEI52_10540 [Halobacteriaceae archaeon]